MAQVNIRLDLKGVNSARQKINFAFRRLKNFDEPLQEVKKRMKQVVDLNFEGEGIIFGKKWQPLAPVTIAHKRYLADKGKEGVRMENVEQILKRTGKMQHGFRYNIKREGKTGTGRSVLKIHNIAPYFAKHQSTSPAIRTISLAGLTRDGKPIRGRPKTVVLPRRVMLGMDRQTEAEIRAIGNNWIREIEKKSDKGEWIQA